jgi:PQQ-like domain
MNGEIGNLAQTAAVALVSAIATDSWENVKHRFAAVARHRERQIDATRAELAAASGSELSKVKQAQTQAWVTRLQDILNEDPAAARTLPEFLAYLRATQPPAVTSQHAQGGTTAGGDITGNTGHVNIGSAAGDVNIGSGKIDKRRYRFFLPFMFFSHAARQAAVHWIITTITVVVVVGGVSSGIALTHKGTKAPAPPAATPTAVPSTAALTAASWSQLHGDPARTGYQPDETRIGTGNVGKLTLARTYQTNPEASAPLIANGILYVASGRLYAFDATGASHCSAAPTACTPLWTAPAALSEGMTVADGEVFVTDAEGIQVYDAAGSDNCSGTPKVCAPLWTVNANGPGFVPGAGSPVVANGVLYVPGYGDGAAPALGGAYVGAFDAAGKAGCSGTPKVCVPMWTTTGIPESSGNTGSPSVANGVLYIADGSLYAFDAAGSKDCTGTPRVCAPLWTAAMPGGGATDGAPAVADGIVYVATFYTGLYAFDAAGTTNCSTGASEKTCAPLWTTPSSYSSSATPAVAHGVVYVAANGALAAFDAAAPANCPGSGTVKTCTLAPLWTSASSAPVNSDSSPTVANGVVYVSADNSGTYAFDAAGSNGCSVSGTGKTCSPLWGAPTDRGDGGSPAIVDGVLYINDTNNGTIYAYSP